MTHVTRLPALVTLNQLSFQFADGEHLFDALDLYLDQRPTAIVGRNGSGKSVLARLISGLLQPSAGTLNCHASVAYVAQEPLCVDGQTVAQAAGIASTLDALARLAAGNACAQDLDDVAERWDLAERFASMLAQAGLSGGESAVAIAVFVVLGSVTVAGPVIFYVAAGDRAAGPLNTIKTFMAEHNAVIMMVVLLVLGFKLLGSGIAGLGD